MSSIEQCLFCNCNAEFEKWEVAKIKCPNCGYYETSRSFADRDQDIVKLYAPRKHLISGLIREKYEKGLKTELITNDNITSVFNDPLIPKTIMQKLDKILLHYYKKTTSYGQAFNIVKDSPVPINNTPYSISYSTSGIEFFNMIDDLIAMRYFGSRYKPTNDSRNISLTFLGMTRAEQLLSTNLDSNKAFVAIQFNKGIEEAHDKAIEPACKECGYTSYLIKDVDHNNGITDEIIAQIKTSQFLVADFTYNNNGVYFEAGYAQGRGLEVIRTCNKDWFDKEENDVHFDIRHYNLILWEDHEDLRKKLVNRIKATIWK